ncbi:MAG: 5'-nucleotidase C-terminal domain-containing protein [Bacteroidota bacterium]
MNKLQRRLLHWMGLGLVLLLICAGAGCATWDSYMGRDPYQVHSMKHQWMAVDSTVQADSAWLAYLAPYQDSLEADYSEIIATTVAPFPLEKPESPLTNLAADMLRRRAAREMRTEVHIGLTNNGSLRKGLPEGEVTRAHLFEMMPFDDRLVVLKLTGGQILQLADQIANIGGQAISGIRMRIEQAQARDVLVGSEAVRTDQTYWVATNDYLANGHGPFSVLWEPLERHDFEISIRSVFEEYMRNRDRIYPEMDNRIRI